MNHLFTPLGLEALQKLAQAKALLAFDYDGTLAPIHREPSRAHIRRETESLLTELAEHWPLAIISGRSLADLHTRIPFPCRALVGNHGMEGLGLPLEEAATLTALWHAELLELCKDFRDVLIENKTYSLSVHYRTSLDRRQRKTDLLALFDRLQPRPRLLPGKFVMNVVPPGLPHKGNALQELLAAQNCVQALFLGDDVTDEDVFALADPRILSIRVGHHLASQASFFLQDQKEIDLLLRHLLRLPTSESS